MRALPTTDLKGYESLKKRVQGVLDLQQEGKTVEFKSAKYWKELKRGIPKDILAISNMRSEGIIIIGVEEGNKAWKCAGIEVPQLETNSVDDMIDHVNKYASPSIAFDVAKQFGWDNLSIDILKKDQEKFLSSRAY